MPGASGIQGPSGFRFRRNGADCIFKRRVNGAHQPVKFSGIQFGAPSLGIPIAPEGYQSMDTRCGYGRDFSLTYDHCIAKERIMDTEKKLTFYGGAWMSFVPVLLFICVAIYVATALDEATIQGMWVGILVGLVLTFFLAKDKQLFGETVINGMADRVALAPVACWIFAGIFATVLRSSGLVDGILWAAYMTGATGTAFIVVTFLASALFATAAGTGFGTIAAGMGVLYPAGVLLGAHPALLAGAIVGGGAFGDNLAPISDTTISSAASQNTDVGGVVRSRLKYALTAGAITVGLIIILSLFSQGSTGDVPVAKLTEQMNPKGLLMLIPALATIYFAVRTGNVIYATIIGITSGSIVAILFGLNTVAGIISVENGALIKGVAGWMADLSILVILLVAGIRIMMDGGGGEKLVNGVKNVITGVKGFETASAGLALIFSALMSINAPAILAVGLSFTRPLGEKFGVHPHRRANIIDAMACTLVYSLPWSAGLLFASGLSKSASETFAGVPFLTPGQLMPWVLYAWVLMVVMFFAIFTGWGRKMVDETDDDSVSMAEPVYARVDQ